MGGTSSGGYCCRKDEDSCIEAKYGIHNKNYSVYSNDSSKRLEEHEAVTATRCEASRRNDERSTHRRSKERERERERSLPSSSSSSSLSPEQNKRSNAPSSRIGSTESLVKKENHEYNSNMLEDELQITAQTSTSPSLLGRAVRVREVRKYRIAHRSSRHNENNRFDNQRSILNDKTIDCTEPLQSSDCRTRLRSRSPLQKRPNAYRRRFLTNRSPYLANTDVLFYALSFSDACSIAQFSRVSQGTDKLLKAMRPGQLVRAFAAYKKQHVPRRLNGETALQVLFFLQAMNRTDSRSIFMADDDDEDSSQQERPTVIATGAEHSALIAPNGNVYTWGSSLSGRLGHTYTGEELKVLKPRLLSPFCRRVVYISCGNAHTVMITSTGEAWSCGSGASGQLGNGQRENVWTPKRMILPCVDARGEKAQIKIATVSAGGAHTMLLTREGSVLTTGSGADGALGHGDIEDRVVPCLVEALRKYRIVRIAAGGSHSLMLRMDGIVYACGYGEAGQLGRRLPNVMAKDDVEIAPLALPPPDTDSTGRAHSKGSASKGHIRQSETGLMMPPPGGGGSFPSVITAKKGICASGSPHLRSSVGVTSIAVRPAFSFSANQSTPFLRAQSERNRLIGSAPGVRSSNLVLPTRINERSPAGLHSEATSACELTPNIINLTEALETLSLEQETPTRAAVKKDSRSDDAVKRKNRNRIVEIAAGSLHSVMLSEAGKVWVCGSNGFGQLGYGGRKDVFKPMLLAGLPSDPDDPEIKAQSKIVQIEAGGGHTLLCTEKGHVYSFGYNRSGQLGLSSVQHEISHIDSSHMNGNRSCTRSESYDATSSNVSKIALAANVWCPERIKNLCAKNISAGGDHSMFLTKDGRLLSCGHGSSGQLGHNTRKNEKLPLRIQFPLHAGHLIKSNDSGVCEEKGEDYLQDVLQRINAIRKENVQYESEIF